MDRERLKNNLENEMIGDIVEYFEYLPKEISQDKQHGLTEKQATFNVLLDLARLVDNDKLIDLLLDYIEAYNINIPEDYFEE